MAFSRLILIATTAGIWLDMAISSQSIGIAKLKDHLSEILREVEAGADIVVVDPRRPIARIVPITREAAPTVTIIPATHQLDAR